MLTVHRFDLLTIFPEVVTPYMQASILGRAEKKKLLRIRAHDVRDWTRDPHRKVDDTPYGGGAGMVMRVEPFDRAVKVLTQAAKKAGVKKTRVILTSASGKPFTQKDAKRLARYEHLIFLCGRYEGVDQRVEDVLADESFSIGPYVLTGGELPALVMLDAIARHVPGVLGSGDSLKEESHEQEGVLEYPQYTKPERYGRLRVPAVLLSGNHKEIAAWRKAHQRNISVILKP